MAIDIKTWYKEARDAVNHLDAAPAYSLLRVFQKNVDQFDLDRAGEMQKHDTEQLLVSLRYVGFPDLPLAEAEEILSTEVISFVRSGIDVDDRLSVRATFTPYDVDDQDRKALQHAILQNKEKIGSLTIGEWLSTFDKSYEPLKRNDNAILDFLTHESRVASLSQIESNILRTILFFYEHWLATRRLNIFDLAFLGKDGEAYSVGMKVNPSTVAKLSQGGSRTASLSGESEKVRMPLLQALSKYENLGNQLITNERIKIKSQPEPVRPSLLYWIKYYRDELGIGHHSTVDRGNFLFRSENGKRLSPEERERVNLVLKSVEENYPVDIDTEHSEIIFPAFVASAPRPQPVPQAVSQTAPVATPVPRPKPAFNFGQGGMMSGTEVKSAPKDAPAPGNLSFTSKHIFPAEKPTTPVTPTPLRPTPQAPRPAPQVSEAPQPQKNPFRIHPVSLGKVKDNE